MKLHDLQKQFVDALDDRSTEIINFIRPIKNLDIYRDSMLGALQKILQEIYPVCVKLVGKEFFLSMINEYIPTNYSIAPDLGDYGTTFPDFIAHFPPVKLLPYLSDVAKLELSYHQLFGAKDNPPFDYDELATCYKNQGNNIVFRTPHKSALLYSPYPIHQIWDANQDSNQEQTINLDHSKHYYLFLWREEDSIHFELLSHVEWQVLSWIQQEWRLIDITEGLDNLAVEINLPELLSSLVTKRWIVGFSVAKS